MRRITALMLVLILAAVMIPSVKVQAAQPVHVLKIGLSYGDNGVPAAKLQNLSGQQSGFQIGFYDANRKFCYLMTTYEREIVILKDKAIWLTSENDYYDTKPSSHKYYIGAYHAQLDTVFSTYDEAMAVSDLFTQLGHKVFPAFVNNAFRLRIGEHLTYEKAEEAVTSLKSVTGMSFTVVGGSSTCYTVAVTGTDTILFELDSYEQPIAILPFLLI